MRRRTPIKAVEGAASAAVGRPAWRDGSALVAQPGRLGQCGGSPAQPLGGSPFTLLTFLDLGHEMTDPLFERLLFQKRSQVPPCLPPEFRCQRHTRLQQSAFPMIFTPANEARYALHLIERRRILIQ